MPAPAAVRPTVAKVVEVEFAAGEVLQVVSMVVLLVVAPVVSRRAAVVVVEFAVGVELLVVVPVVWRRAAEVGTQSWAAGRRRVGK